jgi:hypothetical protein
MKKINLILTLITILTLASSELSAQIVTFNSTGFKNYLVGNNSINTNGDSEIQISEAQAFTGQIDVSNKNISDLTGIEAFTSLDSLNCSNNQLAVLDLSANTLLTYLNCNLNEITSLNLRTNTSLTTLRCVLNELASLDLRNGNNTNMVYIVTTSNSDLTCIDVDDAAYSTTNWVGFQFNFSSGVSFSNDCSTSILTITGEMIDLKAFPNPIKTNFSIDLGESFNKVNIQISNLLGQLVYFQNYSSIQNLNLELEGPVGVYFVKVLTEKSEAIIKVIKE